MPPEFLSPEDLRALTRFVEQSLDHGFRLAIIETKTFGEYELVMGVVAPLIGSGLVQVSVQQLRGENMWQELLPLVQESPARCLALSGLTNDSQQSWLRQLNVQRDLFVRDLAIPWLLFLHPTARVSMMETAPDFCDFATLWIRYPESSSSSSPLPTLNAPQPILFTDVPLSSVFHPLLQQAQDAIGATQFDAAQDLLSRFDLQAQQSAEDRLYRRFLEAKLARLAGKLRTAENSLRTCLAQLTEEQPVSARILLLRLLTGHELGSLLMNQGKYAEAEAQYRHCLDFMKAVIGPNHPNYVVYQIFLAQALERQGRYAEAELILRGSVVQTEMSDEHPMHVQAVNRLGIVLQMQGRYSEAEALFRQALTRTERRWGTAHSSLVASLHGLAIALQAQGTYQEAEALFRRSMTITEKSLGTAHPIYGLSLSALSATLVSQGKFAEAEALLHNGLAVIEKTIGISHPFYGQALHALASIWKEQGKFTDAENLLRRALAIAEKALGENHPELCAPLVGLALVLAQLGQPTTALPLLERARSIAEQSLSPNHPDLGKIQRVQAQVQAALAPLHQAAAPAPQTQAPLSQALPTSSDAVPQPSAPPTPDPADA